MTNAQVFAKFTLKAFDVDNVVYLKRREAYSALEGFNEQCASYDSREMAYGGETFDRFAYDYQEYNLYVYYFRNELMFFVVDGGICGYAVVNESVWDQKNL